MDSINALCRACLSQEVQLNTDEETEKNELLLGLFETFTALTGLETHPNYLGRIFNLCQSCEDNLKFCYEFRELCVQSDSQLKHQLTKTKVEEEEEIVANNCGVFELNSEYVLISVEDDVIQSVDNDIQIVKQDSTTTQDEHLNCEEDDNETQQDEKNEDKVADKNVFSKEVVQKLIDDTNYILNGLNKCVACDFVASKSENIDDHMVEQHPFIKDKWCNKCNKVFDELKDHEHLENILTCKLCNKTVTSRSSLMRHYRLHLGIRKHVCDLCDKTYTTKRGLDVHYKSHNNEYYNCKYCPNKYRHPDTLRLHLSKHPEAALENNCKTCKENFKSRKDLENHDCTNSNDDPENPDEIKTKKRPQKKRNKLCSVCGRQLRTHAELSEHMTIHTGEKPYHCKVCDFRTRKKNTLIEHERTHTGEKPHKCSFCPKSFGYRSNLNLHVKIHQGKLGRPYPCVLCEKRFCRKRDLELHMRFHTGQKPYPCKICPRAFKQASHLTDHLKTHSDVRAFVCSYCGKGFKSKYPLRNHELIHTGERPHKCQICGIGFRRSHHLTAHMKQHNK